MATNNDWDVQRGRQQQLKDWINRCQDERQNEKTPKGKPVVTFASAPSEIKVPQEPFAQARKALHELCLLL